MIDMRRDLREFLGIADARDMVIGTVESIDEERFCCTVKPEKKSEELGEADLHNVPMPNRVMNYSSKYGFIIVPKLGTECLIAWVDGRPTMVDCQEWEKVVVSKEGFRLEFDKDKNIEFEIDGGVKGKAGKDVDLTVGGSAKVEAQGSVDVKAGGVATVDGSLIKIGRGSAPILTADVICPFTKAVHVPTQQKALA